ncbi:MAG: DUF7344 domain-containing protein [Halobacteriota archaeon]
MTTSVKQQRRPLRTGETPLSQDTIFSILSNERRRLVIHYLKRHRESVRLRDLSTQVAAWENGVDVAELTYKQRKRVYTSLHQTHLPKLYAAGIVDYDRDRGTVRLTDRAADLDLYLEVVSAENVAWSDYYLGLSAVAAILVITAWVGVYPFSLLDDLTYALFITLALAISAALHTLHTRRKRLGNDGVPLDGTTSPAGGPLRDERR